MTRNNPQSFGSVKFYQELILLVERNKNNWRKIARLLNRIRRQLRPWSFVCRDSQVQQTKRDIVQSLKDTKLPEEVKASLRRGMEEEFQFTLD